MSRPDSITNEDIARWSNNIDSDPNMATVLTENAVFREVCYAGLWLCEKLQELDCPQEYLVRIQFTAGQLSFGRDPWDVHQFILNSYIQNELNYETDLLH